MATIKKRNHILVAMTSSEWIATVKRLPKRRLKVLTLDEDGIIRVAAYMGKSPYGEDIWHYSDDSQAHHFINGTVRYWKKLVTKGTTKGTTH